MKFPMKNIILKVLPATVVLPLEVQLKLQTAMGTYAPPGLWLLGCLSLSEADKLSVVAG